jgi:hypothetical protein
MRTQGPRWACAVEGGIAWRRAARTAAVAAAGLAVDQGGEQAVARMERFRAFTPVFAGYAKCGNGGPGLRKRSIRATEFPCRPLRAATRPRPGRRFIGRCQRLSTPEIGQSCRRLRKRATQGADKTTGMPSIRPPPRASRNTIAWKPHRKRVLPNPTVLRTKGISWPSRPRRISSLGKRSARATQNATSALARKLHIQVLKLS